MKWILGLLVLIGIGALLFWKKPHAQVPEQPILAQTTTYNGSDVSFEYPASWGAPEQGEGNKVCPEEDTYRTGDSLSIFDSELRFKDVVLPGSESFIRSGIRFYKMDPKITASCGGELLRSLARGDITGAEISSVRLVPITAGGMSGVENENASRLNTEVRPQYTFFRKNTDGTVLVIQVYGSFIPYFGSPELAELDGVFAGDMNRYIKEGATAAPIREHFAALKQLALSIR